MGSAEMFELDTGTKNVLLAEQETIHSFVWLWRMQHRVHLCEKFCLRIREEDSTTYLQRAARGRDFRRPSMA